MKVICITGTPGTGKTALAKQLAKKLNFFYLDVNRLISEKKISEGYDSKRKSKIIDVKKLNKSIIKKLNELKKQNIEGVIIDSHLSHYLPKKYVSRCIVAKCDIKILNLRLKKRKYSKSKIKENLEAEIFGICHEEAKEMKHKILLIDSSKGFNISKIAKITGD